MTRLAVTVAAALTAAVAVTGCEQPIQFHRGIPVQPTFTYICK